MRKELNRWTPKEATIEITYKCPLNCMHCSSYNKFSSPYDELTEEEINRIIDDLASMKGELVEISGGEPLCHPSIYKVIKYAKEKKFKVYLYTSGIVFHDEKLCSIDEVVAERLDDLKVDKIFVNLQGENSATHDSITGVAGSFKHLEKSIKFLTERNLYVGAHFVPMKPNFEQFEHVIYYAKKMGIMEVGVLRFVPQGRGRLNEKYLALESNDFARFLAVLSKVRERKDIKIRLGAPIDFSFLVGEASQDPVACTAGIDKCVVMANGYVIPCPAFKELSNYIAGNIRETSLRKIWRRSPVMTQFRSFDFRKIRGSCQQCSYLETCKGRCPAQRIYYLGSINEGPNGYCMQEKANRVQRRSL